MEALLLPGDRDRENAAGGFSLFRQPFFFLVLSQNFVACVVFSYINQLLVQHCSFLQLLQVHAADRPG